MTDKQLQKLGRRELLQMLLEQAKETERLSQELTETSAQLRQLEETYERLRQRLDSKDAQIHELKTTLQAEREKRDVELQEAGSIAEAALTLNGVFDAAQKAADLYLEQVRALHPAPDGTMPPELAAEETPESPASPQPPVRPAPPPAREAAEEYEAE